MLIVMAGLPGTGKSTLARRLAAATGAVVLDKDAVRAALFPPPLIEYSTHQDDLCVALMLQVAGYLHETHPGMPVILDGRTFALRYQRDDVTTYAAAHEMPVRLIECVCSDETARRRLENDLAHGEHPAHNRTFDLYLDLKKRFEPIDEPKLVVDTDDDLAACVASCLAFVQAAI